MPILSWYDDKDRVKKVFGSGEEWRAFQVIKLGRQLGLSPESTMNELRREGLNGNAIRAGLRLVDEEKAGAIVRQGEETTNRRIIERNDEDVVAREIRLAKERYKNKDMWGW
jgi:hypothetical protein